MHLYLLVEEFLQPRKMQEIEKGPMCHSWGGTLEEDTDRLSFQPHVALRVSPSLGHEKW